MRQQHVVRLSREERQKLSGFIAAGVAPARAQTRARILLKAERAAAGPAWTDPAIAAALDVSSRTVPRQAPRRVYACRLDGAAEAQLIALACSLPPDGRSHWPRRLLADRLVALEVVDHSAPETVRTTLKKTCSSRG